MAASSRSPHPRKSTNDPRTPFVAGFLGECNALTGIVLRTDGTRTVVRTAAGLEIAAASRDAHRPGAAVHLAIRPERIAVLGTGEAADNVMEAVVEEVVYLGDAQRCVVRPAQGEPLTVKTSRGASTPREGQTVRLGWSADAVMLYRRSQSWSANAAPFTPSPAAGGGGLGRGLGGHRCRTEDDCISARAPRPAAPPAARARSSSRWCSRFRSRSSWCAA